MAVPPGDKLTLNFKDTLSPPTGDAVGLQFNADQPALIGVGIGLTGSTGKPTLTQARFVKPSSWRDSAFPNWYTKAPTIEKVALRVQCAGFDSSVVPSPTYVRWRRFVSPVGFFNYGSGVEQVPLTRIRLAGGYQPAPGSNIILNFAEPLVPPPGGSTVLEFGALGYSRVLGATSGNSSAFGTASIVAPYQIRPVGFVAALLGTPHVEGNVRYVSLSIGIAPPSGQVSNPTITKRAVALLPAGIAATGFGTTNVYNFRQYLKPVWPNPLFVGQPYVLGGVRFLLPFGSSMLQFGSVVALNTTADRTLVAAGIGAPIAGVPRVSPSIIYPIGIGGAFGTPDVHRNPSPLGFQMMALGNPSIDFKNKLLQLSGIAAFETGYPRVFDPTRKLMPPSLLETGIFGDSRIVSLRRIIHAVGQDAQSFSPWAVLRLTRRYLPVPGLAAGAIGTASIANKTPSLVFAGISSFSAGIPLVSFRIRYVAARGFLQGAFGQAALTETPSFAPIGFNAAVYGDVSVTYRVRAVEQKGKDSQALGDPTVSLSSRLITGASSGSEYEIGLPRVERYVRAVLGQGRASDAYGNAELTYSRRFLHPLSIWEEFPARYMVGGTRYIRPNGLDATRFGARIIPEIQAVYAIGFSGAVGWPLVFNRKQIVKPNSFLGAIDGYGTARFFNLRQYILQYFDGANGLVPPAWPQWTLVENRSRSVRASGFTATKFGYSALDNHARLLQPVGIQYPSAPKAGMVAYRIRHVAIQGVESPYLSGWSRVHNDAFVMAPSGYSATLWGRPSVVNTRRYFNWIGGFQATAVGYPMVADRIRTLQLDSRYSIAPPIIRLPMVGLYTRYVDHVGFDISGFGSPSLSIHKNIVTPRWPLRDFFGVSEVHNVTPELHHRGRNSEDMGQPAIRTQWRHVYASGSDSVLLGKVDIADRDRTLHMTGYRAMVFGDKLTVVRTGAPPYSLQYVTMSRFDDLGKLMEEGYGIPMGEKPGIVPRPNINQLVLYVLSPAPQTKFGDARITANTIRVEPGYQEFVVGTPSIGLAVNRIQPKGIISTLGYGKPRVSPHTIWAGLPVTDQAKSNHNNTEWHNIESEAKFGDVIVTLNRRGIAPYGTDMALFYRPTCYLKRQYLRVNGYSAFRTGWSVINGGAGRVLEQFDSTDMSFVSEEASLAIKAPDGPQRAYIPAIPPPTPSQQRIELFNRELKPQGFLGQRFLHEGGKNALMVGPPVHWYPVGSDLSLYGEPWISHRVRQAEIQGFDAFICEYDYTEFKKRMIVRLGSPSTVVKPAQHLYPQGAIPGMVGVHNIKLHTQYIRPDGNSDQHRKGAF